MQFTFGIITAGDQDHYINEIINSIVKNNIPEYEIIIVGNSKISESNKIKIIEFDESVKRAWITKKKNIIVQNAMYENIVLLHDYIILDDNWYEGFLKFGENYDWCVTRIINKNGYRFRDYTLFPLHLGELTHYDNNYYGHYCLFPYDFENSIKTNASMYISGSYYVIKKSVALKHPLNEDLLHGGGEDLEYSARLHSNGIFIKCNAYSTVHLLKQKDQCHWEREMDTEHLNYYINYHNNNCK
jgi:hypothetical protein